ncbi:MAG TPA: cation diffusion facilitator family transporter [Flavobacteriia bacterium]|nr:cation diffusion facilitator family transporter [Flavobacteriia bacterium]
MATEGSTLSVIGAIIANLLIAILKFIAATFTGSSAMLSEGIHSIIDTTNGLLLLLGIKRSKKGANKIHPFGQGKEVYFWSFVVAILIFALGGGLAIYEGVKHLNHPKVLDNSNIIWNYAVIIGAIIFEGASLLYAMKQFRKKYPTGFTSALEESKDAASMAIIIEETAAMIGLLIALVGVTLTHFTHNPIYDAISSIAIGVLLIAVAGFLAKETQDLLIGESISNKDLKMIKEILSSYDELEFFGNIKSMHLGPEEVLLALEVNFKDNITLHQLEETIADIKNKIRKIDSKFKYIYIESNSISKSDFN